MWLREGETAMHSIDSTVSALEERGTRELDEFHVMGIEALLDYGLTGGVDQLGAVVFLDEAEGVLEV